MYMRFYFISKIINKNSNSGKIKIVTFFSKKLGKKVI